MESISQIFVRKIKLLTFLNFQKCLCNENLNKNYDYKGPGRDLIEKKEKKKIINIEKELVDQLNSDFDKKTDSKFSFYFERKRSSNSGSFPYECRPEKKIL